MRDSRGRHDTDRPYSEDKHLPGLLRRLDHNSPTPSHETF